MRRTDDLDYPPRGLRAPQPSSLIGPQPQHRCRRSVADALMHDMRVIFVGILAG
jgi:hypothetical protein